MPVLDYEYYWELQKEGAGEAPLPREISFSDSIEENSTVLDIGCGTGRFLNYLMKSKKNVRAMGIDVSKEAIAVAQSKGLNCQVVDINSPDFELAEICDYIIVAEVLEHIPHPEALLLKLKGNYRKALFISIPNIGYYPHRIRMLLGSFPVQTRWHPAEHLRYWTVADFTEWLGHLGYRMEAAIPSSGFPGLNKWWPNLFCNQVTFVIPSDRSVEEP